MNNSVDYFTSFSSYFSLILCLMLRYGQEGHTHFAVGQYFIDQEAISKLTFVSLLSGKTKYSKFSV